MLTKRIRILNFDDSLMAQRNLLTRFNPIVINLKDFAPAARVWLNQKVSAAISARLDPQLTNTPTFFGSGDFHHISSLLIRQFSDPMTVIVFDHHPDWDILPPRVSYGAWVNVILCQTNVVQVILLGVSSEDISTSGIHTANLEALKENRLEIYPYRHKPTRVYGRHIPANRSMKISHGLFYKDIHWLELSKFDLKQFTNRILNNLRTKKVYVSIDKDCLMAADALTNWEEGNLPLESLIFMLKEIHQWADIIGLDITGDYSPFKGGMLKSVYAGWDHPKKFSACLKDSLTISAINEQTNMRILQAIGFDL